MVKAKQLAGQADPTKIWTVRARWPNSSRPPASASCSRTRSGRHRRTGSDLADLATACYDSLGAKSVAPPVLPGTGGGSSALAASASAPATPVQATPPLAPAASAAAGESLYERPEAAVLSNSPPPKRRKSFRIYVEIT